MQKIKYFFCPFLTLVFIFTARIDITAELEQQDQPNELTTILNSCAEYCKKLNHTVLYFTCREEIREKIFISGPQTGLMTSRQIGSTTIYYNKKTLPKYAHNKFVYDYQLIRIAGTIKEKRILLEENGSKKNEKDAELKTQSFRHKTVVFGPTGLLSYHNQKRYEYRITKNDNFKGENAVIIEARPNSDLPDYSLYGKIWIRKKDFKILKIEFEQESLGNYQTIQQIAAILDAKPKLILVSEYAYEKNGIHFPSSYTVKEIYIHHRTGRRFNRSETTVKYKNYKFFTVSTEVKY